LRKQGQCYAQIAVSQPFYLPKPYDNDMIADMNNNPLIYLSGARDLSIIKSTNRQSAVKRQ